MVVICVVVDGVVVVGIGVVVSFGSRKFEYSISWSQFLNTSQTKSKEYYKDLVQHEYKQNFQGCYSTL